MQAHAKGCVGCGAPTARSYAWSVHLHVVGAVDHNHSQNGPPSQPQRCSVLGGASVVQGCRRPRPLGMGELLRGALHNPATLE